MNSRAYNYIKTSILKYILFLCLFLLLINNVLAKELQVEKSMEKYALITGSERGIGLAIVKIFQQNGWKVIGIDNKPNDHHQSDIFFDASVADPKALLDVADKIKARNIRLNCIINNAAIQKPTSLLDTTNEDWNNILTTNLSSIFYSTKAFYPLLSTNSSIVNISSVHARATVKGMAPYVAAKGGVSSLTRAMALELAEYKVRVNAILPGAIDTDMLRIGTARDAKLEESLASLIQRTPLQRVGMPEEIAELAFFLTDEKKAGFITGHEFVCDGGSLTRLGVE